jgi:hypothetical protein
MTNQSESISHTAKIFWAVLHKTNWSQCL